MPLHLLGKKSWNVYNADNVARVRRDEAEARAREEAEEQRMQQVDAERRLAILRGEVPPPLEEQPPAPESSHDHGRRHRERDPLIEGRKRKRTGEDDTDFEMRVARERATAGQNAARELSGPVKSTSITTTTASLVDSRGHITLFSEEELRLTEKDEKTETEAAKKKREEAEQHQVRFTSAAGRDAEGLLARNGPWYATPDGDVAALVPSKNVFGKEDPGRKAREVERLSASDPLAMMKRGAKMKSDDEKRGGEQNIARKSMMVERLVTNLTVVGGLGRRGGNGTMIETDREIETGTATVTMTMTGIMNRVVTMRKGREIATENEVVGVKEIRKGGEIILATGTIDGLVRTETIASIASTKTVMPAMISMTITGITARRGQITSTSQDVQDTIRHSILNFCITQNAE
ncbi:hypothetical protein NEUTE1DRAFT_147460 [Neurospora tetrasperma FGSC 2508]|uniref:CBF1-interacting co-repressor CIR N-terminal domain-containing protein n=1 Tax=Neurospora tetrasperma (strain FGSC 2508 / ATCC MYA-4615 / P0657) TaxID=510951 RepID=F8MNI2_NEUT8|nr:uncharacterized protein NEUTE1DRAFT_147460 [Neurospora tetrasperma FGSC 2508]EGO56950.1 hypothetical protein NEUTE1DRAFT_147460 [Neurospora tetrasperma FGSC 2508]